MFFNNKKKLELKIAKAKADEAKAKAEEAKALNSAEYNKLAFMQKLDEIVKPEAEYREITAPFIPVGVVPKNKASSVAMDSACSSHIYATANQNTQFFPLFEGFPKLSFMMQSSDYFSVVSTTANEMTREWGEFKIVEGDGDQEKQKDRVKKLNDAFKKFGMKDLFNQHIRNELIFGRSQIFIDIEGHDDYLNTPLIINKNTIKKGSLKGLSVIEPIWTTPTDYNSTNPTKEGFFKPSKWYVLGKEIHSDRLLTLISRPVPDMYKPAYNFSGLSMLQLMEPYVQRWQRAVDSAADLLESFSTSGIMTDLGDILSGTEQDPSRILTRIAMWTKFKNNRGAMVLDKATEEFFQVNTPLTHVPELMRHLQEQMAAPSHTPLVKLLGLTPNGLNANSEGEIRVYYDYISAEQEFNLLWQIERVARIVQLHLFGDIDENISFAFKPLYQLSAKEISEKVMYDTQALQILLSSNVISTDEARKAVAALEDWILAFIDPNEMPEPVNNEEYDYGEEDTGIERLQAKFGNKGLVQETA